MTIKLYGLSYGEKFLVYEDFCRNVDHNHRYKIWSIFIETYIACNGNLFKFWSTCFDRHMHYAFLHVCLYIVECSLFTIHCSMQPLKFYGSGMWSRALGFQGSL